MASQPAASNSISVGTTGPVKGSTIREAPTYWAQSHAPVQDDASVQLPARLELLREYGTFSLAYSVAVQPHLKYFGDANGYLAYRRRGGITFVLGDPICSAQRRPELLRDFLQEHHRPSFVQISRETAQDLSRFGFTVNEMGVDTRIDLSSYTFAGKEKEWLRYADNWISKRKFRIEEGSIQALESEIVTLSEAWRSTRTVKRKEVRFLNRPIVLSDEIDTRRFFLFDDSDRMVAFVFFDPIYSNQEVIGYVTCFKRRVPDAPQYAEPAIMKRAIEKFQGEGRSVVWLGLSPLANIEDGDFRCNRLLHWSMRYYHQAGWLNRYFYNFEGHTQYKARFRGTEVKTYYATRAWFNTYRLLAFSSLCGVF